MNSDKDLANHRTLKSNKPLGVEINDKLICTQTPGRAQILEVLGISEGRREKWTENRTTDGRKKF